MARNFRISVHRKSENVHLKLIGDFDGASAYELLHALARYGHHASRIYIDTSSLKEMNPFGLQVFQDNLDLLKGGHLELVFAGGHASELAPEKPIPLYPTVSTAVDAVL